MSPELIQGSSAAAKWQQPFDAALTDVFEVQGQIAARVAEALGLALGAGERDRLGERPTDNLAAYDAFLQGEEAVGGDLATQRRAVDYYERAVALDSTFALAWAQLSLARVRVYWVTPTAAGAAAVRRAAERALALAPKLPEGYFALAFYYYSVQHDVTRALEQSTRAWQLAPKDARFLAVVAQNELALGHTEEGLKHLREAQVLDPRSVETATRAVSALVGLRRYSEALQAADRALALAPADLALINAVVEAHLAQGDLAGARAVLRAVPREVDPAALVAYTATWGDLYWVLDEAQQRLLLRLSPAPFGDDRATWGIALAETHALRGDTALAEYYSSVLHDYAHAFTEDSIAVDRAPGDADRLVGLGYDEVALGRWAQARGHLEQAVRLDPRAPKPAGVLGDLLILTRHYPEAQQMLDRALLLQPTRLWLIHRRIILELARGDLGGAQAILRAAPRELDPTAVVAYFAYAQDLMWVLDEAQQQLLLRLTPSAFDDDRGNWGLELAQTYWLRGDRFKARVYSDSARLVFEDRLRSTPEDGELHVLLGLALAYLGQKAAAIREGKRGVALSPISRATLEGPYRQHQLVRIYMLVGEPERALDQLEPLLKTPYYLSPGWLKIDPNFAPLRGNPRFERLVNGE